MAARAARLLLSAALWGAVSAAVPASASEPPLAAETRLRGGLDEGGAVSGPMAGSIDVPIDVDVRRWEYVILVRTAPEVKDALGRAQIAAMKAGGAVLDDLRMESTASHADWRVLVRTRSPEAVHEVVKAMRGTRGVLGASATPLPETPTYPGGPEFFESWSAGLDDDPRNAGRVVMRHDVPPIASKKELLEMSDVLAPPSTGPDGTGGFTLNVSEIFARLKEGAWRRREEKLRNTPIEILPPAPAGP